ncbi:MAG: hypothetical protein AB1646_23870 [Thermodesulfobacteriota bacterium]
MFRTLLIPTIMVATLFSLLSLGDPCLAEPLIPQAPADMSWIPHGYGGPMYVETSVTTVQKGVYGFRDTPKHTAAWSQPMWGWDVNGFYAGPNVPCPDPGELQLPIGLIYPVNGPQLPPPPPKHARRVHKGPHRGPYPGSPYPGAVPYPQPTPYSPQIVPSQQGGAVMGVPGAAAVVYPGQQPMGPVAMGPPAPPVMQYAVPVPGGSPTQYQVPMASAAPVAVGYGYGGQPF